MSGLRGSLLALSYKLNRHYMGELSLGVWIVILGLGIVVLGVVPRVHIHQAVIITVGVIGAGILTLLIWGRINRYGHFSPDGKKIQPRQDIPPIAGKDHVKVRATGQFSVEGKEKYFVDLEALYHTFETREHAVMAHVKSTRFLGLGKSRFSEAGMWYVFFRPEQIERIQVGHLEWGRRPQRAMRIVYRQHEEESREELILVFSSEHDLHRAIADLHCDLNKQ